MLIAAHIMGVETYCLTELLSVKRTGLVVRDYEKNYEKLFTKISLEEGGKRYQSIRLNLREGEGEEREREKLSEEEVSKNRLRVQNHFIERNYYSSKKEDHLR